MIEILLIPISLLMFIVFSNFPINYINFKSNYNFSHFLFNDFILLNLFINFNILLFISFFSINLNLIFLIIFFVSIFFFIKSFKQFQNLLKENFFLIATFFILFYAISTIIIKNAHLEWDALAHWIIKVKIFFQGGTVENLKNIPFDYYPHLGSYIWAFFWKSSLFEYEYVGRLFYLYILLICIFSLYPAFSKKFSELEKLILIFVLTFITANIFLFGGYQEYLIFFCFFGFSNFFIKFKKYNKLFEKSFYPEIIIFLITNSLIWIKQEGLFYYLILNFLFLIHLKRNMQKKIIFLLLSFFSFLIYFFIKKNYFGAIEFNDDIINSETLRNFDLTYLFSKIIIISKYFFISFVKYPIWLLIIISIIICNFYSNYLKYNKFIFTFIFLTFGFIYCIFLNTPDNLSWLVPLTLNRLVFTLSGFLIFLVPLMFNILKKKSNN